MMTQDNPELRTPDSGGPAAESAGEQEKAVATPRETELEAEVAKLKDQVLRAMAETENTRRRLEQQAEERGRYAVSSFAKEMLGVADNLRRALESVPKEVLDTDAMAHKLAEGVELTERGLITALERHGIKRIEALGQRFDPHLHQAMMEVEDPDKPAGTVVFEMQAGYTIQGRLLRPALVSVSKGGAKPQPAVDTTA